tara:strand:+ start:32 stop:196 length:165 start_codon:yes stop_codon:yes gene_type:complete
MPKMSKTQVKASLMSINSKAFKLLGAVGNYPPVLTIKEYGQINDIILKAQKRIR